MTFQRPSACVFLCLILCGWPARGQGASAFPPPKERGDPATLGQGIQRTMSLLAASTPQHRNTVKILF
jgi:hypothetical protein